MSSRDGLRVRGFAFALVAGMVLGWMLSGCGSSPTATPAPTDTAVVPTAAATATPAAPTVASSTATSEPTTAPAAAWQPLDATACTQLADDVGKVLGTETTTSDAEFTDYASGDGGTGCQASATGTGAEFGELTDVAAKLQKMLEDDGWKENVQYQADGPTGTAMGFEKGESLCLLSVNWEPSADADCPEDQPISACDLKPGQKEFTIDLNCAQRASK